MNRFEHASSDEEKSGLCNCPYCYGEDVCPIAWREDSENTWWMYLRCGNCGLPQEFNYVPDQVAKQYDRDLDNQSRKIFSDLARLTLANMEDELNVLIKTLKKDLVDADDFAKTPNLDTSDLTEYIFKKLPEPSSVKYPTKRS